MNMKAKLNYNTEPSSKEGKEIDDDVSSQADKPDGAILP